MTTAPGAILAVPLRRIGGGAHAAWGVAAALVLSACTVAPAAVAPDFGAYRAFLIEDTPPALQATGAVSLSYKGQTESGELFLSTARGAAAVIQIKARITGSLVMEVRFDQRQLLVLDYVNKAYYQGDNTPETRKDLFNIDLSPEEFRMVVTGRVVRRDFERGQGMLLGPHQAAYRNGSARYIFTLGDDGLPLSWVKQEHGEARYRVEYRGYAELPARGGPPVRLPKSVRVYILEGKPAITLGLREFAIPESAPDIGFALPPEAADFQPE